MFLAIMNTNCETKKPPRHSRRVGSSVVAGELLARRPYPKASTTRPSIAFPPGTSTIDPVRLTRSPSLIAVSLPKTTIPTFSFSRFNAIPFTPLANSTISKAHLELWVIGRASGGQCSPGHKGPGWAVRVGEGQSLILKTSILKTKEPAEKGGKVSVPGSPIAGFSGTTCSRNTRENQSGSGTRPVPPLYSVIQVRSHCLSNGACVLSSISTSFPRRWKSRPAQRITVDRRPPFVSPTKKSSLTIIGS
ncbi:hypothetical protein NE237_033288 [Protea cynaroides]|uniref:Uncharacterized protein n=1 Tax=Protea cynaroides TaxID=273540 RepID=A0A9Q0L596_9MAGN|nr:hypothetical protein NE237_033288 [Protea cynaroides]